MGGLRSDPHNKKVNEFIEISIGGRMDFGPNMNSSSIWNLIIIKFKK